MIILGSDFGFESFDNIKDNSNINKDCEKIYCVVEFMGGELYIDYVKDIKELGKLLFDRLEHAKYAINDSFGVHMCKSEFEDIDKLIYDISNFDKLILLDNSYIFEREGRYRDDRWYIELGIYKDFIVADFKVRGDILYDFKIETYIK